MDIIDRLKFDATRCEATFSKGVAKNIEEAIAEIERLRAALGAVVKDCETQNLYGGSYLVSNEAIAKARAVMSGNEQ